MKTLCVLLLTAGFAFAADVESGPKVDTEVAKLKVNVVTGTFEGKEIDFPTERKDEPTVYMFVNSARFDRPIARFMKEFDKQLPETNAKAHALAVWVGGDVDKNKDRIPKIQGSISLGKTDMATSKTATPEGWGLNDEASLTVVVVKAKKVVKVFAFRSMNETDTKKVLDAVK